MRDEATKAPPENYYHGFLSAMLVCAGDRIANLHSNAEEESGFADLVFMAEDLMIGAVIVAFSKKLCIAKAERLSQF